VLVPRQPLARWVIGTARALQPIANLMRDMLLGHDVIHMDKPPVQVLNEPGRAATSKSQMWVQRGRAISVAAPRLAQLAHRHHRRTLRGPPALESQR
jgi:hypothetical protein